MSAPRISVVIRSFLGEQRLPRTLTALEGTQVEGGFEVIIVDDGSPDETRRVAAAFEKSLPLRVVSHATNLGRAAAGNTGFREAGGRIVLILDDDMKADPGLVRRHAEAHESAEGAVGAIGRIEQEGLDARDPFHAFLLKEEKARRARLLAASEISFGDVWTGQFSIEREAAEAAGLFDPEMRGYGLEDVEFGYRLALRGVRFVYLDDAVSHHAAYVESLQAYCERHASVGEMAAYLVGRYDTDSMRRYLRVDPPEPAGSRSSFIRLMDMSAAMLRHRAASAFFAGPVGRASLRGVVQLLEWAGVQRPLAFAYSFLRDVQYFHAMARARDAAPSKALPRK